MAPVSFVTYDRIRWVMANLIQPRVNGDTVFLIKPNGSWEIRIVDNRIENQAEAKQHGLIVGENEHELDLILDKFQNHKLEVVDGKVTKVKRTPSQSRHRSKKSDSVSLGFGDNPNDNSSFFD